MSRLYRSTITDFVLQNSLDTLREDMDFIKALSVWGPLAAGPHTVREIFLARAQD